jgi:hypothetical protein
LESLRQNLQQNRARNLLHVFAINWILTLALRRLTVRGWGKRMYPQVSEEYNAYASLSVDRDVIRICFRYGSRISFRGWKGALRKDVEIRQAQRKTSFVWRGAAWIIACFYAELGEKDQAFRWPNTAYSERNSGLISLKPDSDTRPIRFDPRICWVGVEAGAAAVTMHAVLKQADAEYSRLQWPRVRSLLQLTFVSARPNIPSH